MSIEPELHVELHKLLAEVVLPEGMTKEDFAKLPIRVEWINEDEETDNGTDLG